MYLLEGVQSADSYVYLTIRLTVVGKWLRGAAFALSFGTALLRGIELVDATQSHSQFDALISARVVSLFAWVLCLAVGVVGIRNRSPTSSALILFWIIEPLGSWIRLYAGIPTANWSHDHTGLTHSSVAICTLLFSIFLMLTAVMYIKRSDAP